MAASLEISCLISAARAIVAVGAMLKGWCLRDTPADVNDHHYRPEVRKPKLAAIPLLLIVIA
jgi:hypothetical protein